MEKVKKYFFYYLQVLFIYLLPGQNVYAQGEMWKYYLAEYKDLPNSTVYAVAIDSNKTVWFGTSDGLASFDGTSWKQFDLSAYHTHPWKINHILVDNNNVKWICTTFGLFRYDDSVLTYIPGLNPLWPDDPVYSAALDNDNNLFLSLPELIVKYNGTLTAVLNLPGITGEQIKFDKSGSLWISNGDSGMLKYDGQNLTPYLYIIPGNNRHLDVSGFDINSEGEIWVVGMNGFGKLYNENWTYYKFSSNVSTSGSERIRCGKDGNIYFTTNYGVIKFDGITQETLLPGVNKDSPGICLTTEFDTKGTMWIGTYLEGAIKIENGIWTNYDASYGLPSNIVNTVVVDKNNVKWIGTYKGLVRYDGVKWTLYNRYNSPLISSKINILFIDKNNNLWIGNRGLAKFDGINWNIYTTENSGLIKNSVSSIAADNDTLWISTWGGLSSFGEGQWKSYTTDNSGLKSDFIIKVAIDKNGAKWIVTDGDVPITTFDGKNWGSFSPGISGPPDALISSVFVDNQNNKWFGCSTGLASFYNSIWQVFNQSNTGIDLGDVRAIKNDKNGNIIFSLYWGRGLIIYNGQQWSAYNHVSLYDSTYGTTSVDFAVDKYNNKWLATSSDGLLVFNENGLALSINNVDKNIPTGYRLYQNYPNPFNPVTQIKFKLISLEHVKLEVFDILGRRIVTLVDEEKPAGNYSIPFVANNLPSGVYIYQLRTNKVVINKKMLLLK